MNTIEGVKLSQLCDYSFGDQASIVHNLDGAFMKPCNLSNIEFLNKIKDISGEKSLITLFVDNIRLYRRPIIAKNEQDQNLVDNLMLHNSVLELCSQCLNMKFIIFTNLEDTPIEEAIEEQIPSNVIAIYAANCLYFSDKVIPIPYGLQRKLNDQDNRLDIIDTHMQYNVEPNKLLYMNHNIGNNTIERSGINELFGEVHWATVQTSSVDYPSFLSNIQNHKFTICPIGNAVDCHRNWEVLYMKRVPVMKKHPALEKIYDNFPVLFVDEYSDITQKLLMDNDYLYQESINMDMSLLDLDILFNRIIDKFKEN